MQKQGKLEIQKVKLIPTFYYQYTWIRAHEVLMYVKAASPRKT
jgi:hypothetical protein